MPSGEEIDREVEALRAFYGVKRDTPLYEGRHMWDALAKFGADMRNFRLVKPLETTPKTTNTQA